METYPHDLSNLFQQLGLHGDISDIEVFLETHRLPVGMALADAPFWSPAQTKFLEDAIADDSDWSEAVDDLAARLS